MAHWDFHGQETHGTENKKSTVSEQKSSKYKPLIDRIGCRGEWMDSNFGKRIKHLRKQRGLTQTELADALGISKAMVSSYESDTRNPTYENLMAIALFFNVSMDWMFGSDGGPYHQDVLDLSPYRADQKAAFQNMARAFRNSNDYLEMYSEMMASQIYNGEKLSAAERTALQNKWERLDTMAGVQKAPR